MRKEKMITRTFEESEVNFMAIDLSDNNKMFNMVDVFPSHISRDVALKECRERWETATTKVVAINEVTHRNVLRGMPESTFIAWSTVLPPRTKETETENE